MVVSMALALIGIGLAYLFYGGGYRDPARRFPEGAPGFVKLVQDKFRIDELYDAIIIRPLRKLAQGIFFVVDRVIIDKVLVEGSAAVVGVVGRVARSLQGGDGQSYMPISSCQSGRLPKADGASSPG